ALLILSLLASASLAQTRPTQSRPPGADQADVHNPYSSRYLPLLPNQSSGGSVTVPGTVTFPGFRGTVPGNSFYSWPYYNTYVYPYGLGFGYNDYYSPGYYDDGYPYYDRYRYGYWGARYLPAETL